MAQMNRTPALWRQTLDLKSGPSKFSFQGLSPLASAVDPYNAVGGHDDGAASNGRVNRTPGPSIGVLARHPEVLRAQSSKLKLVAESLYLHRLSPIRQVRH